MNWYSLYKLAGHREKAWLSGTLHRTHDGFVYLNVSNDIINGFFRGLDEEGVVQPPYREPKYNGIGAHISVMDPEEMEGRTLSELGKKFKYQVSGIFTVDPQRGKMQRIWALEVQSPELEELRRRYGLPPKLRGHDFHITFAVRYK